MIGLINGGDCDAAIAVLDAVIAAAPDHRQALFLKGEALRQSARPEAAEEFLTKALQLSPTNGEVLFRLGLTRYALGKRDKAEEALAAAVESQPDHQQACFQLGVVALELDHLALAERAFRAAAEGDPPSVPSLVNLALCLDRQGKGDDAVTCLERAARLDPGRDDVTGPLLQAYIGKADYRAAERLMRVTTERQPENPRWVSTLGWVLSYLGRHDEAAAVYRRAIELQPDVAEHVANMGSALRQAGRSGEAAVSLHRAISLDPISLDAHLGVASLHLDAGLYDEAANVIDDIDARVRFPTGASRSVVIPVLDYSPGSLHNIGTLLDDLKDFDGEVICVFNSEDMFNDFRHHPRIDKFSFNKHNVGVARGWNIGINQAEGATIHVLNADLHVSVPMLNRLEHWLHTLPDALCVGVSAHWIDHLTLRETRAMVTGSFHQPIEVDTVSGQLFSLHAKRLHDAGIMFDPRLSPYFGEEVDLAIKARQSAMKIYAVPETDFDHSWGISRHDRPIYYFGRRAHRIHCMLNNQISAAAQIQPNPWGRRSEMGVFHIVHVIPDKRLHILNGYNEVIKSIIWGLRCHGHEVTYAVNTHRDYARNIIFGANMAPIDNINMLPADTIIYNSSKCRPPCQTKHRKISSSTYQINFQYGTIARLTLRHGRPSTNTAPCRYVSIGFAPVLCRIRKEEEQDIDILIQTVDPVIIV